MPIGIKQERREGWRMPKGAMSVARPHLFGNPFHSDKFSSALDCVEAYDEWLETGYVPYVYRHQQETLNKKREMVLARLPELRGHDLACFCSLDNPCHRNPLLRRANS